MLNSFLSLLHSSRVSAVFPEPTGLKGVVISWRIGPHDRIDIPANTNCKSSFFKISIGIIGEIALRIFSGVFQVFMRMSVISRTIVCMRVMTMIVTNMTGSVFCSIGKVVNKLDVHLKDKSGASASGASARLACILSLAPILRLRFKLKPSSQLHNIGTTSTPSTLSTFNVQPSLTDLTAQAQDLRCSPVANTKTGL